MEALVVGFTGRREGITDEQCGTLKTLLTDLLKSHKLLCMHNDGVGSDQVFCQIANDLGAPTGVTPKNLGHMKRNRFLVDVIGLLIAVPPSDTILKSGSGSWETVKYMWKKPGEVLIVLSDGSVKRTKAEFEAKAR